MEIDTVIADYQKQKHAEDIRELLDIYATDPMGGGKPLVSEVKKNIVTELSKIPHAFSILAYKNDKAVALANCFQGFSTFNCKPIINIHDFMIINSCRGLGFSQKLLEKIEHVAIKRGCCKITLEVLSNNSAAKAAYMKFGFNSYELNPDHGSALFWQKLLG
ncbi:MAG: GNAT family N-acetyltransferase [Magnetococcales bacterium]|nr:GNAT family N-acetyltransferase [Magnetococcales bacterium]